MYVANNNVFCMLYKLPTYCTAIASEMFNWQAVIRNPVHRVMTGLKSSTHMFTAGNWCEVRIWWFWYNIVLYVQFIGG